jgi:hypothetical protein
MPEVRAFDSLFARLSECNQAANAHWLPTLGAIDDVFVGKLIYAGVFALLIIWLILIPANRIGQEERVPPWWKNVRVWGIIVATTQMFVYLLWP